MERLRAFSETVFSDTPRFNSGSLRLSFGWFPEQVGPARDSLGEELIH